MKTTLNFQQHDTFSTPNNNMENIRTSNGSNLTNKKWKKIIQGKSLGKRIRNRKENGKECKNIKMRK